MTARDPTTQHWYALRSECDDVALNVETSTLYNSVDVVYTDAAGVTGRSRRAPRPSRTSTRAAGIARRCCRAAR
jgi:hypothetical protein